MLTEGATTAAGGITPTAGIGTMSLANDTGTAGASSRKMLARLANESWFERMGELVRGIDRRFCISAFLCSNSMAESSASFCALSNLSEYNWNSESHKSVPEKENN